MKILNKEKSDLIDRTLVISEVSHLGKTTPTNLDIRKEVAKEFKVKEELVVIKQIGTKYGEGTSVIKSHIYDNINELKRLEKVVENKEDGKKEETKEQKSE